MEASLKSLSEELARYKELKVRLAGAGEISLDEARRDFLRVMDAELERKANENAFQLLKGPWTFVCDRCGTTSNDELTAFGVEELVRKGQVQVECDNPACEDRSLFSTGRHRFKVSLHELIELYITGES